MPRTLQHVIGRALFDHLAVLKHDHAIGDVGDNAEIMGDEHHRHVAAALQVADQLQDLRLRGDVERGGRFVRDQHRRLERERHRDHRALALAAGQLVRIGAHRSFGIGQADLAQEIERLLLTFPRRQQIVRLEHLGDLVADPHQRVERRHRLLEHHGDAAAAQSEPLVFIQSQQVPLIKKNLASLTADRIGQEAHQGVGAHRLAGAGFADHAEDLAGDEIERHAVDGVVAVGAGRQRQLEVIDDDDGFALGHAQRPSLLRRGLRASLRPSPIRFSASTETRMAMPGNTVIHQACRITVRPAPTM